jgi:phage nucleotide-binding protein
MNIEKSKEIDPGKNIVMIVYGKGGTGKTTFAATAPKPLMIDFENGSKFLGERGFDIDVIRLNSWLSHQDKSDLAGMIGNYDSVIIDPLGEAMDKLIDSPEIVGKKYRAGDGGLTMAGWGEVKKQMRNFIKYLRGTGKNIIIVAHDKELQTEEGLCHRIQIATGLASEIPNMVDIISYLGVQKIGEDEKRCLFTPQQGGNFDSKDRTDSVPRVVEISEKSGWNDFIESMKGENE